MKKKFQKEANMIQSQTIKNKDLKRRIIEISYKNKLSHIGSCLTAVDIIDEIYSIKKPDEKFVLSSGHAHLAHLVVMQYAMAPSLYTAKLKNTSDPAKGIVERMLDDYGIHCDRRAGCDCSSGSLGNGLPIAVGMALADRSKNVYCLVSDGECSEGSIWEALRIAKEQRLTNLTIYVNVNGYGAYKSIDRWNISEQLAPYQIIPSTDESIPDKRLINIVHTSIDDFPFLKGQEAHYRVMDEEDYKSAMEVLK